MLITLVTAWYILCSLVVCLDASYDFKVSYGLANVDGQRERRVILINDAWPLPTIRVNKGDRVLLNLTNLIDDPISVHFHGILQKGTNEMDGAAMLTQCDIASGDSFLYNFTVDQVGTYWYHSHSHGQYGDGLRGIFLVDDPSPPFHYDYDLPLSVSDWYYKTSQEQMQEESFIRGSEPVVDACLFNETVEGTWKLESNSTYYLRIVNIGMSLPQYLYLEDHLMTIVEIDGVYVDPIEVDSIYITVGQRYGVLINAKPNSDKNYRFVQILQKMMSTITAENWLVYNESQPLESEMPLLNKKQLHYPNELDLKPLEKVPVYDKVDKQIYLKFAMESSHYSFNHNPYEPPLVPTLYSVISSPNSEISSSLLTYGNSTNTYILEQDEIVEIIVDSSQDMMRHPFHLHGHNFQVLYHGKNLEEMEIPQFPMIRDTVNLKGYSKVVLRFKADNPGVWIFHCHIDWHLIQGLAITLVEGPEYIRNNIKINDDHYKSCRKRNIGISGNSLGEEFKLVDKGSNSGQESQKSNGDTYTGFKIYIAAGALIACLACLGVFHWYKRRVFLFSELAQKEIELDEL